MKKLIFSLLIATLAAGASAQTVASANVMGYSKVSLKPGIRNLVACNFIAGTSNTLRSVLGTNQLSQSATLGNCDIVTLFDPQSQSYQAYAQWTDGNFYKANSQTEFNGSPIVNPEVPIGTGFWINRASAASSTNIILISGDVVSQTATSNSIGSGLQIVAYPYSSDIELNDLDFPSDGATGSASFSDCDKISVFENGAYQSYGLYTDGNWYKANDAVEWQTAPLASNAIVLSQSFWYYAQSSFTWDETNRYSAIFE